MKNTRKMIINVVAIFSLLIVLGACSSETKNNFIPPKNVTAENSKLFSENGTGGIMYSKIIKGTVEKAQKAIVLTDESCEMDDNGITHCFNNIRLENGDEIRVNTLHVMKKIPCLKPNEEIEILSFENNYVKIIRS